MIRFSSIRARMTTAFSISIALLLFLVSGFWIWHTRRVAERSADTLLNNTARRIILELTTGEQHVELPELIEQETTELRAANLAMLIVDRSGRIIQRSQPNTPPWPMREGGGWRVATIRTGSNTIVLGLPWAETEAGLHQEAAVLLSLSLFASVIAAAGAWLLVGRTLSPIRLLSRQARSASTDGLKIQLRPPSQDAEIVELVATLNGLLGRLSEAAAAKGRFYAAASHELRTPLQALSGHLELGLDKMKTVEEYQAVIGEAHQQTRRLISLVRALLLLHQLESAASPPPTEPTDLAEICERTLSCFTSLTEERGLRMQTQLLRGAVTMAPPTHAEMLIRNLVENAVKYAPSGSVICLGLTLTSASLRLTIFNECADFPLMGERMLEPFFRADASRNARTGGNGLGLAICNAIAIANGWQLIWEQEPAGVRVAVIFPNDGRSKD